MNTAAATAIQPDNLSVGELSRATRKCKHRGTRLLDHLVVISLTVGWRLDNCGGNSPLVL